jgi:hypothetical protein
MGNIHCQLLTSIKASELDRLGGTIKVISLNKLKENIKDCINIPRIKED